MNSILAITMGDVNGVGPEIIAKAFADTSLFATARPLVLGSVDAYEAARRETNSGLHAVLVDTASDALDVDDGIAFLRDEVHAPVRTPGELSADAGRAAMEWLDRAIGLAVDGSVSGIVTGPIHKEGIHRAGYTVRGHTDYIAEKTNSPDYRMCLFTETLGIVHLSDHVSLRKALDAITVNRIVETTRIGWRALQRMGMTGKGIAIAGLNPHAGEAGAFGDEEVEIILPAIEQCQEEGILCSGPHSPDAVFKQAIAGEFDMVIAMYHDQGHIPLKLAAMDEGVNVTLGIPVVRTSVDHGTAYDIAGRNLAREDSLCAAYRMAGRLAATTVAGR